MLLCGDAVRTVGQWLLDALVWFWSLIDAVLQPVLSPVLGFLNPAATRAGDYVFGWLSPLPIWAGLTAVSVVTGVVMLIAFKYLSNQKAITRAKDDIKGNLLALKLFKDDLRVTFRSQWRLLKAVARLQRYVLTPVLILFLPMMMGLAQMGMRYQWRPLRIGEAALMTAHSAAKASANPVPGGTSGGGGAEGLVRDDTGLTLIGHSGLSIEVDGIPGGGKIVWRIRPLEDGVHTLLFAAAGVEIKKELVIGDGFTRVSPLRPAVRWTGQLLYPVEPPVPTRAGVSSIEVVYPPRKHWFYGADWWVLSFFVISMLTAIVLKPVFRVKF